MSPAELLALFRIDVDDLEPIYLWADTSVYGWIDEAQKQFCRLTYGIEDARTFSLAITAPNEWYDLDPTVLKVRGAMDSITGYKVPLIGFEKMAVHNMRFNGASGPPRALITGLQKNTLRVYPVPSVASTINLVTFRLPEDIPSDGQGDFEVDDQHVRNLLLWVKYRAYAVQDSEMYDKKKSETSKADFEVYCATAKTEQDRANRSASTVAYGGI